MPKTIAIDFDGVIHSYTSGWTGPVPTDPPVDGALKFINKLLELGYKVSIYSTRFETFSGSNATVEWLTKNGFPIEQLELTFAKPKAIIYIDDRAFRFDGDFAKPLAFIRDEMYHPWYTGKD